MTAPADTRADLLRALGVFAEPPGPHHPRLADLLGVPAPHGSQWSEAFVVQLVPHASIYLGAEGMLGGEAAQRIAGFWHALRLPVPADPDHLTALLGLYAALLDARAGEPAGARRVLLGNARAALLHEHLLSWLLPYTHAMSEVGPAPYAAWARLLGAVLRRDAGEVGAPPRLPAHLRTTPPPATMDDDLETILAHLLRPAHSGLILARGHLAALARDARLGLRLGDRRRVLRALIEQDPAGLLRLLAERAQGWAARHAADEALAGPIATHWAARATATATLLRDGAAAYPAAGHPRHDPRRQP
jgi:Nitrate reductase delta subunit